MIAITAALIIALVVVSVTSATPQPQVRVWLLKHHHVCLVKIIDHEDGTYDPTRHGAGNSYGIPQANPGYKMVSAGKDWASNPFTQIRWMIGYVNGRYGSECNAWNTWYYRMTHSPYRGWY